MAASLVAIVTLLAAGSILYWQGTRPTVSIQPSPPAVEPAPPAAPSPAAPSPAAPAVNGPGQPRALEQQLETLRTTARRQLTAGRPQEALDTISAGLVLDASDATLRALVDELTRTARQSLNASRGAAGKIVVTEASAADLRDARRREREAEVLERSGDRVAAVRALWMAASLYDRTVKAAAGRNLPPEPPPPAATAPRSAGASAPQPERVESPAVIPLAPGAPPPGQALPPPLPPPPAAKPADAAVDARAADLAAIRDLLRRYVEAYRARDIGAVAKVMPALTTQQLRALERDFSNLRSYQVEIADERIALDGSTATVTCSVVRSFVSRTGTEGGNTVPSLFHLRKVSGAWVVESLQSR
jgi:hypothetical protein